MSTMTVRVNRNSIAAASKVLARIGMTPRTAIDVFMAQIALKKGLPFTVTTAESDDGYLPHVPNAETAAAIAAPSGKRYRNAKAFLASL